MEDEEHDSVPRGGPNSVATPGRVPAITASQWRRLPRRVLLCVVLGVALAVASCSLSGSSQPMGTAPIGRPGSPKPIAAMSGTAVPSGSETASSSPIAETLAPSASPYSSSSATLPATSRPTPLLTPWPSVELAPAPSQTAIPTSTPQPSTPAPTPTPAPQVAPLVDVAVTTCATGDSESTEPYCVVPGSATTTSWVVTPVQLPWTTSQPTSEGYLAAVELNSSPYWWDLTFCYSVMPEDDGSLDGMGSDGCSVGPSSGGSFGGSPTPPSETEPTIVVWVWMCAGTDMAACQAYGASQGWILPGNF
jgi:hypothetical protein